MEAVRCARKSQASFSGCPLWPRTQVQLIWLISAHSSSSAKRTWFFFRFQPSVIVLMSSCEPEWRTTDWEWTTSVWRGSHRQRRPARAAS